MIIGALLAFLGFILLSFISLLPLASTYPVSPMFLNATDSIFTLAYQWEYIFPVNFMIGLMGVALVFWIGMFAMKVSVWTVTFIRG
jgi:uncharacterized membrane protein